MTKKQIADLIHELTSKMEKLEEEERQLRDDMYHAAGQIGELQLMIWKLEKMK